ncbi:MAG: COX15/CtaA family protein [Sphingobacteriaceae bacterium]|nr:COX15/CtaA family protein [Sphingobacteriaceae bacterium]
MIKNYRYSLVLKDICLNFTAEMELLKESEHKSVIYWLLLGCFLIYVMVVVGCLTRLTHSGLSITDWNFMGSVPPLNESMWQERFEAYKQSPEFSKINYDMTLAEFKPIFLWEYIHRMIGRTMMYVFSFGLLYFIIRKKISKKMWPGLGLLFFMGAMQAVIGWWMVYSGLQSKPAVSHYRLAIHLMSAFTLFAFTFWFALKLIFNNGISEKNESRKLKLPFLFFFITLITQIVFGAFTAGFVEGDSAKVRPGHIYNTWPKMGEEWMAETVTAKNGFLENVFENAAGIQFTHRMLALLVVLSICIIWYKANKLKLNVYQQKAITWLIYGVTIQFMLGVFTLLYNVPVVLGALHQTGAFFLFAISIYFAFHLYKKPESAL